jgi:hypothetical protein
MLNDKVIVVNVWKIYKRKHFMEGQRKTTQILLGYWASGFQIGASKYETSMKTI